MSVVVGFSGGVDSSTVVARAKREGRDPIACLLVMRGGDASIPPRAARSLAEETAELLGVPYVEREVAGAFRERVVEPFARAYASGRTPNPCSLCNPALKVKALLEVADEFGAERVLTGHYARMVQGEDGVPRVARAADLSKDQSYFLARLPLEQRMRLEFPLASLEKREVRAIAADLSLPTAKEADSQGVCFAADGSYKDVIAELASEALEPGEIVTEEGEVLGLHHGIASVTVGQRKGLHLSGGPWFVTKIDAPSKRVTVTHGKAPRARELALSDFTLSVPPHALSELDVCVQTHYRAEALPAKIELDGGDRARVRFSERHPLAAPGQSAVLYCDDVVLGEGTIEDVVFSFQGEEGR